VYLLGLRVACRCCRFPELLSILRLTIQAVIGSRSIVPTAYSQQSLQIILILGDVFRYRGTPFTGSGISKTTPCGTSYQALPTWSHHFQKQFGSRFDRTCPLSSFIPEIPYRPYDRFPALIGIWLQNPFTISLNRDRDNQYYRVLAFYFKTDFMVISSRPDSLWH
jgi:hypothetical protein